VYHGIGESMSTFIGEDGKEFLSRAEERRYVESKPKKWLGTWPAKCDACKADLTLYPVFYNAEARYGTWNGHWGLFCQTCFDYFRCMIGPSYGQKYDSKTLIKLEG
jgi:hypothetical protein